MAEAIFHSLYISLDVLISRKEGLIDIRQRYTRWDLSDIKMDKKWWKDTKCWGNLVEDRSISVKTPLNINVWDVCYIN